VDDQVLAGDRPHDEPAQRALADLAGPVDVERPDGDGGQALLPVVRIGEVLLRELADRVRPAALAHGAEHGRRGLLRAERELAEDLARAEADDPLEARHAVRGLEHVGGADHVDLHRVHGLLDHRVDAGDPGAVHHVRGAADRLAQRGRIEHAALDQLQVGVSGEGLVLERVAAQVVERDDLVALQQHARQRRADEAGSTRDEHPLALELGWDLHRSRRRIGHADPP
jgi:hypothetical protein